MKITLKELRRIIKEELMVVNAKTGSRFPVLDSKKISSKILDDVKELVFDVSEDEFWKLQDELGKKEKPVEIPGVHSGWGKTPSIPKRLPIPPRPSKDPRHRH